MKRRSLIIFSIFSSILFFSCSSESPETKAFDTYLNRTWQMHIPEARSLFVLVPGSQCKNCNRLDSAKIKSGITVHFYLISEFGESNFPHFKKVYQDTTGSLSRLAFVNYSSQFVITEKKKVTAVIQVTDFYRQLDSISGSR